MSYTPEELSRPDSVRTSVSRRLNRVFLLLIIIVQANLVFVNPDSGLDYVFQTMAALSVISFYVIATRDSWARFGSSSEGRSRNEAEPDV